ncbi:PREDICTED: 39S ribosomal protein L39, mitochondrial [Polistes canadensis]|uniref:39S ribosomal protein L39, mitochondrial n=1 Tax=Polistes canadensis TaxID=91411 RepID=UPI000718E9D6|nr:PREDICTED: 39S ribosomal protein L39, mitochondrial [Polistes canadensis]
MFQRCGSLCLNNLKLQSHLSSKYMSTLSRAEAKKRRNALFEEEKKMQRSAIGRIEKIEVKYKSPTEDVVLIMNKDISTPHDCAKHISEGITNVSALALVDGNPWDMHKPFKSDCNLELLSMMTPKISAINYAFWRTCSFILGAVADTAFKDDITVHLHSFPVPVIKSGSFVYDVFIDLPDWKPTEAELRAMSALFIKFINSEIPIERLETTEFIAKEMFCNNPFKYKQIPDIAANSVNNKVTLYRIGDHIDISKGPMIGNTKMIGRCTVSAVHKLTSDDNEVLYRFQGVAIPKGILLNHFAYSILENRAKKLNDIIWQPQKDLEEDFAENIQVGVNT